MKPQEEDAKEMVGGCCVCSDENGWTENPLVYCDGQGCNVAVHQACYGIVTVPTGAWFCRKCESQERAARQSSGGRRIFSQRCELCPSKDGALKRTDSGGWAHVVCALYIPEVRFGNVTTMEPIMLQLIPQERFNKSCYLCEESGKESRSTLGACMQCNKSGCKQHFHVTCAQSMGLLCEEAGNYLDNVKYCGYCQYHFSKLRKGSNVKTIPPYRPVPHDHSVPSDEEKAGTAASPTGGGIDPRDPNKQRKRTGRPPGSGIKKLGDGSLGPGSASGPGTSHSGESLESPSFVGVTAVPTGLGAGIPKSESSKLSNENTSVPLSTTSSSNNSGSGSDNSTSLSQTSSSSQKLGGVPPPSTSVAGVPTVTNVSSTIVSSTITTTSSTASSFLNTAPHTSPSSTTSTFSHIVTNTSTSSSLTSPSTTSSSATLPTTSGAAVSTPSSTVVTTVIGSAAVGTVLPVPTKPEGSQLSTGNPSTEVNNSTQLNSSNQFGGSNSSDLQKDKNNKKIRRNGPRTPSGNSNFGDTESNLSNDDTQSTGDLVLNICEEKNLSATDKDTKDSSNITVPSKPSLDSSDEGGGSLNIQFTTNVTQQTSKNSDPFTPTSADFAPSEPLKRRSSSQDGGRRAKRGVAKRGRISGGRDGGRDSGASSPDSFTEESAPPPKRGRKKVIPDTKEGVASVLTNGISPNTVLLGNQLNPASTVAKQMTDTLHAELEAHSIYKEEEKITNLLVGPAIPGKKENSTTGGVGNSQPPPFPQSLEQLLERQWEQGSQFLMEQAQHFDIASLLSCLHQLRQENVRLEETVSSLIARRDHLLAVNARLSVPLSSPVPSCGSPSSVGGGGSSGGGPSSNSSSSGGGAGPPPTSGGGPGNPPPSSSGSSSHPSAPRPPTPGRVVQPSSGRLHNQSTHTSHPSSGSAPHSGGPSPGSGGGSHRGPSPHDRRGPSPQDRRNSSPHDRRPPLPVENGLGEGDYRYRSPSSEHRQQSPMLPPGAQPSPNSLRHSPAGGNYHSSVSPHGVPSLSPGGSGPHSHGPPTSSSLGPPPSHGTQHSISSSHGPSSHGGHGPHGPQQPHGPPPPSMVSVSHGPRPPPDHRGDMVRLHQGGGPGPPGSQSIGPGGYPVYQMGSQQMVSPPGAGPHHPPVGHSQGPPSHPSQPPPPHSQHSQVRPQQQQPTPPVLSQPSHTTHSQVLASQAGPHQGPPQPNPQISHGINPQGLSMATMNQGLITTTIGPQHPISNGTMVHQGIPKVSTGFSGPSQGSLGLPPGQNQGLVVSSGSSGPQGSIVSGPGVSQGPGGIPGQPLMHPSNFGGPKGPSGPPNGPITLPQCSIGPLGIRGPPVRPGGPPQGHPRGPGPPGPGVPQGGPGRPMGPSNPSWSQHSGYSEPERFTAASFYA